MLTRTPLPPDAVMPASDRAFYEQLGQRIAQHRKGRGVTQVELAKTLGIAQQTLAHYEGGTVRIGIATLTEVASALSVPIETLLATPATKVAGKRGPAPKIQQQLERVAALPKSEQRVIAKVLDSMLAQSSG